MEWIAVIPVLPYAFLLAWICRSLLRITPFLPADGCSAFVSVVIACRDEEKNLPSLLRSLENQDYPREFFEIILVDDNSTDQTAEIARSFAGVLPLKILLNNGSGKKEAIRTGTGQALGELILATDADCTMGPGWISTFASFYGKNKPGMITGAVRLTEMPGFFGRFQELEFLSLQAITAATAASGNATICNGANLAFTKAGYEANMKNLRFDIATGDDVFLLHSMKKEGSKIMWLESDKACVTTNASDDPASFLKQRRRWASKATAYTDSFSIILGIITFAAVMAQAGLMVASIFNPEYIKVFLVYFIVKSIPDFIILYNTTSRYGRKNLLKWFLPSQLIYPWYVFIVIISTLLSPNSSHS
jgi:cellulose synthase/poly-beta-1,6-N-acetylglucosamine synthase-like glycosyltransferase